MRGVKVELPLMISGNDVISGRIQAAAKLEKIPFLGRRITPRLQALSKKYYWKKIAQGDYDMVVTTSPVFEDTFLNYLPPGKRFLMVVHDTMRCVLGPEGLFDTSSDSADKLAYLSRRASKVICISKKVQNDIIELADVDRTVTRVIYTGNLLDINRISPPAGWLPDSYLLFVGLRAGRKNFRFFLQSIAALLNEEGRYLVCTGKCTRWEADLLDSLSVKDKVIFLDASDAVLVHLYKHAACLIYPSLYEGYGLPALEAMSLGCPVITSEYGGLKEIGGEAVIYIDPYSKESMLKAVKDVLQSEAKRGLLRERGLRRANGFTTESMVSQFIIEMEELCEK